MPLQIRKFDPATMKPGRIILVVGKRGTGKSVVLRDLLFHMSNKVDFGVAMTPTEESIREFERCMPKSWIYRGFEQEKIDDIVRVQRRKAQDGGAAKKLYVVLDDCMYQKGILKSESMRQLMFNGRHLNITLLFAAQYLMEIGPETRTQIDYVICTRETIQANKVKLWRYFFGVFERYDDFVRVLDKCTADYGVLVMDNTQPGASGDPIANSIFWYRASTDLPTFRMGKDVYWKMSEQFEKTELERRAELEEQAEARMLAERKTRGRRDPIVVQVTDEHGTPLPPKAPRGGRPASPRVVHM